MYFDPPSPPIFPALKRTKATDKLLCLLIFPMCLLSCPEGLRIFTLATARLNVGCVHWQKTGVCLLAENKSEQSHANCRAHITSLCFPRHMCVCVSLVSYSHKPNNDTINHLSYTHALNNQNLGHKPRTCPGAERT